MSKLDNKYFQKLTDKKEISVWLKIGVLRIDKSVYVIVLFCTQYVLVNLFRNIYYLFTDLNT